MALDPILNAGSLYRIGIIRTKSVEYDDAIRSTGLNIIDPLISINITEGLPIRIVSVVLVSDDASTDTPSTFNYIYGSNAVLELYVLGVKIAQYFLVNSQTPNDGAGHPVSNPIIESIPLNILVERTETAIVSLKLTVTVSNTNGYPIRARLLVTYIEV
jgi:hypothetical protein